MPEIPPFYCEKGSKFQIYPLEKGMVFNFQNYDGYTLLMALTLPRVFFHIDMFYQSWSAPDVNRWAVCVILIMPHILMYKMPHTCLCTSILYFDISLTVPFSMTHLKLSNCVQLSIMLNKHKL